jgi:AraC-like DNA-binding protein
VGNYFDAVRLPASVWWKSEGVGLWYPLHDMHLPVDTITFERHFGRETWRADYNFRSFRKAERRSAPFFAQHSGLWDLWVPLRRGRDTFACLAAGPFWRAAPDAKTIRKCYERLSGKAPRDDDPTFAAYVRAMLDTPLVDDDLQREMLEFGAGFAHLMAGAVDARSTFMRLQELTRSAEQRRPSPLMWNTAGKLVDRFDNPTMLSFHGRGASLGTLRIARIGTDVLAASPLRDRRRSDPVEAEVRGRKFQSDCVELARAIPSALLGRLGDDGVFMIVPTPPRASTTTRRALLRNVATRLRKFGSKRGVDLVVGIAGRASSPSELPDRHPEAVLALQWAMHTGEPTIFFEDHAGDLLARSRAGLYALSRDLRRAFERGEVGALSIELDRFIKEVLRRSIGDVDVARGYFEAVTAELFGSLEQRAIVDAETVANLSRQLHSDAQGARFLHELSQVFLQGVQSIARIVVHPGRADRRARLDRARTFLDRNFADPLRLERVARLAGLSPTHFSKAFKQHTGVGFERYLLERRLDHAKSLLRSTELPIYRVAAECGFSSYVHFARAFRRSGYATARSFRRS